MNVSVYHLCFRLWVLEYEKLHKLPVDYYRVTKKKSAIGQGIGLNNIY